MKQFLFVLVAAFAVACNSPKSTDTSEATGPALEMETDADRMFGEPTTVDNAQSVDMVIQKLAGVDSLETKVEGKVTSVCQKKGCWMNVESADGSEMFVRFKDYGFFMPLDLAGQEVVMQGKAFKEVVSVDELRHYAEDEGKSPEEIAQITEPKAEYRFMASGVVIK